jgi:hypothetical protein
MIMMEHKNNTAIDYQYFKDFHVFIHVHFTPVFPFFFNKEKFNMLIINMLIFYEKCWMVMIYLLSLDYNKKRKTL